MEEKSPARVTIGQMAFMAAGIVVFGLLMGIRPSFESMWIRAGVAACAFFILGVTNFPVVFRNRAASK